MPGRNVQTKSMIISLLGSFEGLQHNPQPQLSFDTQCKKVLGSSFTNHTPRTFPPRIVICCTLSDLSYLGVFSTGFFFMWDSPAFLPYTMIWYMAFHPHQCFFLQILFQLPCGFLPWYHLLDLPNPSCVLDWSSWNPS